MESHRFEPLKLTRVTEPIEITSIEDALYYLASWPEDRRTEKWRTAVNCCECAREGVITNETARRAVAVFAFAEGILDDHAPNAN